MDFEVRRDDLTTTRFLPSRAEPAEPGQILAAVERFAFSANNITYGLLGDRLRYWDLFPATGGWGRIPVWGYLRVVTSRMPGVEVGARAFGLSPMSTHVVLTPGRRRDDGFVDVSPHRGALSPVYNAYTWLDRDPVYRTDVEDQLLVLGPVFWLSYLVDDLLAADGLLTTGRVLITSASSRVGIALAHLLAARGVGTIGLTAAERRPFVAGLGVFDAVHSYDQAAELPVEPCVLVDVAGDRPLREAIGRRYGAAVTRTVVAGFTHGDDAGIGPAESFLFVPDRLVQRAAEIGWPKLNAGYRAALHRVLASGVEDWLAVDRVAGPDEVERVYHEVRTNAGGAGRAHVLTLSGF